MEVKILLSTKRLQIPDLLLRPHADSAVADSTATAAISAADADSCRRCRRPRRCRRSLPPPVAPSAPHPTRHQGKRLVIPARPSACQWHQDWFLSASVLSNICYFTGGPSGPRAHTMLGALQLFLVLWEAVGH